MNVKLAISKAYLFYYPRDISEATVNFCKLQQQHKWLPGEGAVQTASPISTNTSPSSELLRSTGNNAPPTAPNPAATHFAPQQAANAPRPKAAVERLRRRRPSAPAGRLPTPDEQPGTPGSSFGQLPKNPPSRPQEERGSGRAGLRPARPRPSPPRPGPRRPAAALSPAAPGPGAPGLVVRVQGWGGAGAHDRPPTAPPCPEPAAPEKRPETPTRTAAGTRPAPPQKSRHRSAGPLEAAAGRAHHYPARTSASASPRHRPQAASAQAGKPPLATITNSPRWRTYQLLRALLSLRPACQSYCPGTTFLLGSRLSIGRCAELGLSLAVWRVPVTQVRDCNRVERLPFGQLTDGAGTSLFPPSRLSNKETSPWQAFPSPSRKSRFLLKINPFRPIQSWGVQTRQEATVGGVGASGGDLTIALPLTPRHWPALGVTPLRARCGRQTAWQQVGGARGGCAMWHPTEERREGLAKKGIGSAGRVVASCAKGGRIDAGSFHKRRLTFFLSFRAGARGTSNST